MAGAHDANVRISCCNYRAFLTGVSKLLSVFQFLESKVAVI